MPYETSLYSPLSFQVNKAFKASRGKISETVAGVTPGDFKHDLYRWQTKREYTPRKRSGLLRCWISFIGVRCWMPNQRYETM